MAGALLDARAEMSELKASEKAAREKRRDQLVKTMFGNPRPTDATAVVSCRDALDRAEQCKSADEAMTLLEE